jgi:hypothetical protein
MNSESLASIVSIPKFEFAPPWMSAVAVDPEAAGQLREE